MEEAEKKQIIESVIELIDSISNKEYQRRVWIRGEGPEVDSFDETVCNFSQDGGGVITHYKEFGLTEFQYQVLKDFQNNFKIFVDDNDLPQLFIDTPEWTKITEQAKKVLEAFKHRH